MEQKLSPQNKKAIHTALICFILAHPIIDIITAAQTNAGYSITFGVVIRTLFMAAMFLYTVFARPVGHKRICLLYLTLLTLYIVAFLAYNTATYGFSTAFFNLKEMTKTFYFSYVFVGLYIFYRQLDFVFPLKYLSYAATIYMAVIFIAFATNTSYKSYMYGFGYSGWFFSTNEIGSIVVILSPISLLYAVNKLKSPLTENVASKYIYPVLALFVMVFCSTFIGTKVVFVGISGLVFLFVIWTLMVYLRRKNIQMIMQFLTGVVLCLFIALSYFVSPLRSNINKIFIPRYSQSPPQSEPSSDVSQPGGTADGGGQSPVFNAINWALSNRLLFLAPLDNAFKNSDTAEKLLGMGYYSVTKNINKPAEMDFFSVFYRQGYIGLILYIMPILYVLFVFLKFLTRNFKKAISSLLFCVYAFGLIIGLLVSLISGHTLIAPAVSIYIVLIMLNLLAFIDRKTLKIKNGFAFSQAHPPVLGKES